MFNYQLHQPGIRDSRKPTRMVFTSSTFFGDFSFCSPTYLGMIPRILSMIPGVRSNINPRLINPMVVYLEDTIISQVLLFGGTTMINEPGFVNPGLTWGCCFFCWNLGMVVALKPLGLLPQNSNVLRETVEPLAAQLQAFRNLGDTKVETYYIIMMNYVDQHCFPSVSLYYNDHLPSGNSTIAIENGHWNSGFDHWKWWIFP